MAFAIVKDVVNINYWIALGIMIVGTVFVIIDTLKKHHSHGHYHTIRHTHDGSTHSSQVYHEHEHEHLISHEKHQHHHSEEQLSNSVNYIRK